MELLGWAFVALVIASFLGIGSLDLYTGAEGLPDKLCIYSKDSLPVPTAAPTK